MKKAPLIALGVSCLTAFASEEIPLASSDKSVASQARGLYLEKGKTALPKLREYTQSDDPRLRARANEVIGTITGQYGSPVDLIWNRSLADAITASQGEKPILFLHLFGKFDEEFC